MTPPLYCIAHRGGPGPENSLEAIRRSLALGVDAIEIDIWQVEGELLVTHDRRLGRQIKAQGLLIDQPLSELRKLTLSNGEPIPTLHQVLELIGGRALLNIEIKGPECVAALVDTLTGYCSDSGCSIENYVVSSFDHQQLYQMLQLAPGIRRGVLVEGIPLDYAGCCAALQAYAFNTSINFINRALIDDARARGLKNWVYTVNAADDWQWLRSLGVDGVFTDRPEQLLAFNQTRF
jgi:glycerophosphoryl diester phosphodiesterase